MSDQMKDTCYTLLALFKFEGLLSSSLLVVNQKRLDELKKLVDGASRLDDLVVLDDSFADAQGDCSLVLELHVVHKVWIVVHAQNADRQGIQWDSEEFDE